MKSAYLLDISRATDAKSLHEIREAAKTDKSIEIEEFDEILVAWRNRFGALNLAAVGEQNPRW